MHWIPIFAWIGAAVVAAAVLGFCAYEILGKARRLRGDVAKLQELAGQLGEIQQGLAAAQERLAAARLEPSAAPSSNNG